MAPITGNNSVIYPGNIPTEGRKGASKLIAVKIGLPLNPQITANPKQPATTAPNTK